MVKKSRGKKRDKFRFVCLFFCSCVTSLSIDTLGHVKKIIQYSAVYSYPQYIILFTMH